MADIKGPGILYVEARISRPDIMDEATYMNWYDNDHIAEIIETSGVDSAFRYKREGAKWPYLAMYEMRDIAFTQGEEFRKIRVYSDLLPGTKLCYDLADNNVRYYRLEQVYDPTNMGPGHTRTLISAQYELKEGYSADDFDAWYRKEVSYMPVLPPLYGCELTCCSILTNLPQHLVMFARRVLSWCSPGQTPSRVPSRAYL